ncbi:hypothetical protein JNN41_07375 [Escherichia coli]|nr:hypothetical protein [Escherichia coli]QRB06220.1 hypothetical protein JNN41_07375 [Escherichia coli]
MLFTYTQKQKQEFLKRFGQTLLIDNKETLAIVEIEITNVDGQVSETFYITIDEVIARQDLEVHYKENIYRIAYIVNDGSGLVNAYLSLIGDNSGRTSKYE